MDSTIQNDAFLSLRHLVKVYPNGEKAVYDFNLDIAKKEFIVIVGPSGCGKSTTLRMIAGLEDISDGDIYLGDELLNYKPSSERKMAIVFQSYALYPQMTVYNNIAFPLTINKYPMPVIDTALQTNSQILNILKTVDFKKIAGVMYNVAHEKGRRTAKEEDVASIFGVTYETGKLLSEIFTPYLNGTIEDVQNKESELRTVIQNLLAERAEQAENKNKQEGIKLDGEFCVLDENGNKKIEHRKYTPYEIKTRVYETAEKLDLVPYLDKLPKELSGGQMQRVALGRAIIKKVPIFMMDEPLSNLDAKLRLTMRSEIVKLHNSIEATTIYVTHDQTEAMTMASRIVVMSRGFIQQIGTPEDVYNYPANIFVAKFIGSPTMNVLDAEYDRQNKKLVNGGLKIPVDDGFIKRHDALYAAERDRYRSLIDNFDEKAKEHILKTLSVTGEYADRQKHKQDKKSFVKKVKALFAKLSNKDKEPADPYEFERNVCAQKLAELEKCTSENHGLTVGIRPERIKLEKKVDGKEYGNCLIVKPTVCELLGGEYNVHFTFCGKNMVGQLDAKEKITTNDEIAVKFSMDDLYIFDPITGKVI